MVDVGGAEVTPPRVFEDAERLPTSLACLKVLKAGRSMSKVQIENRRCWQQGLNNT